MEDEIEGGNLWIGTNCRKFLAVKGPDSSTTKAAGIDYILDAQKKGEIDEDNVLYMIENVNAAGTTVLTCNFFPIMQSDVRSVIPKIE